jgi:arylformamidase
LSKKRIVVLGRVAEIFAFSLYFRIFTLEGAWMPTENDLGVKDRAAIDAEYDPSLRVPSRQPYMDWYVRESALAREKLDCRLDLPFGATPAETVDIFPSPSPNSPVVIFIHGGYWRALSSKEFSYVATGLVPHGITVVVMNYTLCPEVTIAGITAQSRAAVAWVARNAAQHGGDPQRIYVAGHSAGGQQVAMLLSGGRSPQAAEAAALIKGGVAVSGLFDLRPLQHSWLQPTLQLTDSLSMDQSPLFQIPSRAGSLVLSVGGEETPAFHRQSHDYLAAWRKAGLRGDFVAQHRLNHYEAVYGFGDPASALTRATLELIQRTA